MKWRLCVSTCFCKERFHWEDYYIRDTASCRSSLIRVFARCHTLNFIWSDNESSFVCVKSCFLSSIPQWNLIIFFEKLQQKGDIWDFDPTGKNTILKLSGNFGFNHEEGFFIEIFQDKVWLMTCFKLLVESWKNCSKIELENVILITSDV